MDIFLPQVLHKQGRSWRALDYERDILGAIDWDQLGPMEPVNLEDQERLQEIYATIHLQEETVIEKQIQASDESGPDMKLEISFFVRRLGDVITNPWLAARIVKATLQRYRERGYDEATLYANRLYLSEILKNNLRERIDELSESVFRAKLGDDKIRFNLVLNQISFVILLFVWYHCIAIYCFCFNSLSTNGVNDASLQISSHLIRRSTETAKIPLWTRRNLCPKVSTRPYPATSRPKPSSRRDDRPSDS